MTGDIVDQGQLLRRLKVLEHGGKIRTAIIKILTGGGEEIRLFSVVKYLCELAVADAGYFLLVADGILLSVAFHSRNSETIFSIGDGSFRTEVPQKPVFSPARHQSYFGKLDFDSSLILPIHRRGTFIGLIELGCFGRSIDPARVRMLTAIHKDVVEVYAALFDHIVEKKNLRSLTVRLDETESAFNMLMNDSQDIILTMTADGEIRNINRRGRSLLEIEQSEEPGLLQLENPSFALLLKLLGARRTLSDMEIVIKTRTERVLFCLASLSAEYDEKNEIEKIHAVLKDITDRVDAQRQLWEANIELNEANEQLKENEFHMVQSEKLASIGYLAAGVAHEINNPLGFIKSNFDTLQRYLTKIGTYLAALENMVPETPVLRTEHKIQRVMDDLPTLLSDTDQGFVRISKIVTSLKNFSHIDSEGAVTMLNLNAAIDDTLTVAKNSWKYVAEVQTDYQLAVPVECMADQINQVFLNIIVNAAQAIESQHRETPGRISIKSWEQNGLANVRIHDDGPGIPLDIREKVFTPFFTTKPIGQGTGLGLSICFDIIVKKHKGRLSIEDGEGAAFLIQLPLLFSEGARDVLSVN